jgi:hypothetical protein
MPAPIKRTNLKREFIKNTIMGRELKRVPLDFKWPIDQLWKGYVNPYGSQQCKACDGGGHNPETKRLSDTWYDFENTGNRWCDKLTEIEVEALVREGRLSDLMPYWYRFDEKLNKWFVLKDRSVKKWEECEQPEFPTPETVNNWERQKRMGHDAINRWICIKARAKHLGIYGHCEYCNGEGEIWQSEEIKQLSENWERFDPPTGEGFQLWTTTNEGSPMTPAFNSLEALCEYCEKENVSVFGGSTATKERWMEMLNKELVYYQEGNAIFL